MNISINAVVESHRKDSELGVRFSWYKLEPSGLSERTEAFQVVVARNQGDNAKQVAEEHVTQLLNTIRNWLSQFPPAQE